MSEEQLVSGLKRGESGAWELFYGSYSPWVLKTACWQGWNFSRSEIQDIVQEVFLEFYRGIGNFRGEASLATYLAKLTRNICISRLRKFTAQKRSPEVLFCGQEGELIQVNGNPGPEEQCLNGLKLAQLKEGVFQLSPDCRRFISLRYFSGLAYREISKQEKLSLGTVCSKLARCLKKLRQLLENSPGFYD